MAAVRLKRSWLRRPACRREGMTCRLTLSCALLFTAAPGGLMDWGLVQAAQASPQAAVERCIDGAALQHRIHPAVLRAVLTVESRLNPSARNRNPNGTVDLGVGQINSVHLPELSRMGIGEEHLLAPCVGTYVAAWHLGRQLRRHGESWWGVGSYHSLTPHLNHRYQVLVHNEMVRAGALPGPPRPLPPRRP